MWVGTRTSIKEKEYSCHAFVRADNTATVVSDDQYPPKVAHTIALKILEAYLKPIQEPKEAELDETKIILQ
jgi:synaptobrevin family protein YKT6